MALVIHARAAGRLLLCHCFVWQNCDSAEYRAIRPLFVALLIVVVIGGPLLMLAYLFVGWRGGHLAQDKADLPNGWHKRVGVWYACARRIALPLLAETRPVLSMRFVAQV